MGRTKAILAAGVHLGEQNLCPVSLQIKSWITILCRYIVQPPWCLESVPVPGLGARLTCGITSREAELSDPVYMLPTRGLRGNLQVPPCRISPRADTAEGTRADGAKPQRETSHRPQGSALESKIRERSFRCVEEEK